MSAPSRRLDQYWRWPILIPNAAEDLRGMKVLAWQDESWLYPNEKGSSRAAIPRQPIEPHVHDVPLHMWFGERGMVGPPKTLFRITLVRDFAFWGALRAPEVF